MTLKLIHLKSMSVKVSLDQGTLVQSDVCWTIITQIYRKSCAKAEDVTAIIFITIQLWF